MKATWSSVCEGGGRSRFIITKHFLSHGKYLNTIINYNVAEALKLNNYSKDKAKSNSKSDDDLEPFNSENRELQQK